MRMGPVQLPSELVQTLYHKMTRELEPANPWLLQFVLGHSFRPSRLHCTASAGKIELDWPQAPTASGGSYGAGLLRVMSFCMMNSESKTLDGSAVTMMNPRRLVDEQMKYARFKQAVSTNDVCSRQICLANGVDCIGLPA